MRVLHTALLLLAVTLAVSSRNNHQRGATTAFDFTSVYLLDLVRFNATNTAGRDTFTLSIDVAVDKLPPPHTFMFLRFCTSSHFSPEIAMTSAGMVPYNDSMCRGTVTAQCDSYPVALTSGALNKGSAKVAGVLNTDGGRDDYDVLLDLCALISDVSAPPLKLQGAFSWMLCPGNKICFGNGTTFGLALLYAAFALVWGLLVLVWGGHMYHFRHAFIALQRHMLLVPFAECVYMALTAIHNHSESGLSRGLFVATLFCRVVSLATAANEMLLIAHGWKITRDDLGTLLNVQYRLLSLAWALALSIVDGATAAPLIVFVIWCCLWTCLVYTVWSRMAFNIAILHLQMDLIAGVLIDPHTTPVASKLRLFVAFRRGLVVYFVAVFFLNVALHQIVPVTMGGLVPLVLEGLYMCFCVGIGCIFRCRDFSPIFYVTFPQQAHPDAPAPATTNAWTMTEWHEGIGLPTVPAHVLHKKSRNVVVQSPGDATGLGTVLPKPTAN
ncbi:hypothetical protein SDRG_02491 [Saprolegnia diclina VS20]|uniref:Intimal thickness related receptor IRP domain-containing protein n=1 Tax=Saprolegnia diclina (strain VS20) TaxID=1156394 RepID=T0R2R3_SAPDV|nr:hypothetical protein SDRG_02491 [Saprolegnia diclina VS20]EQC40605.1 hypothetical protein SDRG_02491 [Saprolegnia diclina VS20]|eukprot:XP_008606304.1 hypothetical protein SDRG_02491 [Saprolegnia diclina VS20]